MLLSGAPVSGSSFHSPQPRSLSLCSFLLQPSRLLGLFLVGSGLSLMPSLLVLSLAIFLVAYLLVSLSSFEVIFRFALSHLPGGVQLFWFSLGALPVRSSGLVRGVDWSSWLSPLPAAWLWIVVFISSLWFGWCFGYLPCGPTPDLSLASWLFNRFFPRGLVAVCFP